MKRRMNTRRSVLGTRGESMVVAIVLMLVFFILGLAVMTGASVANSSVNSRMRYRQAYYYARSTLDLLDESLQSGELGEYVREYELSRLLTSGESQLSADRTLDIDLSFDEAMTTPEGIGFSDGRAVLSYRVDAQYIIGNAAARILISDAKLSFRTEYGSKSYGVEVLYAYSGVAEKINGVWMWTGGWRLRSMA